MSITDRLRTLDTRQQRSPRIGFVAAVVKKFGDDQAGQLAALIAYYGFVSLFPLLLVLVTVLGFVLQGSPSAQASILLAWALGLPCRTKPSTVTSTSSSGNSETNP